MIVHPIYPQESQEAQQDSTQASTVASTAYDSIWATSQIPEQGPVGSERFMLAEDKLYVVFAVVLIIWFGIAFYVFRTNRKLAALESALSERSLEEGITEELT